jgi:tetratricopeptide (TPR) repeat protein
MVNFALNLVSSAARTPRIRMKPPYIALVIAALTPWSVTASAMVGDTRSELREYVHARLADAAGLPDTAANSYAQLMAATPGDRRLAMRTYRQALTAGNFGLAGQAAQQLDRLGALPSDGALLLLSQAIAGRDWTRANALCDRIGKEDVFTFLLPVVRAWIAVGSGKGHPLQIIDSGDKSQLAATYAREHHILIGMVAGGEAAALADLRALVAQQDVRALRLQLAVAALLSKRDPAAARSLLEGRAPELVAARARLDAGKPLDGAIDTPALGVSELLAQLAIDVKGDGKSPVSLQLARLATYLAPTNAAATIATADLLSTNGYQDAALSLLGRVPEDNPLFEAARQVRTEILVAKGESRLALAEARKMSDRPDADATNFVEVGSILNDLGQSVEAAAAFQKAIDYDRAHSQPNWSHLFLKAGALDRAGQWPAAKDLLREANRIDPAQAIVLNYLGYGMLEHGDDLAEAQVCIERASALDPSDAAISDSLGWLYYKRGNYAGAVAALERAVAADPAEPVMHDHLGDAYWSSGRRLEARYAWRAALVRADKDQSEKLQRKLQDGLDGRSY